MKTHLKDNIFIEGFDLELDCKKGFIKNNLSSNTCLYIGKTSEIPEEIAKKCVELTSTGLYKSYIWNDDKVEEHGIQPLSNTAKESIQSACNQTYCIIYKEK